MTPLLDHKANAPSVAANFGSWTEEGMTLPETIPKHCNGLVTYTDPKQQPKVGKYASPRQVMSRIMATEVEHRYLADPNPLQAGAAQLP